LARTAESTQPSSTSNDRRSFSAGLPPQLRPAHAVRRASSASSLALIPDSDGSFSRQQRLLTDGRIAVIYHHSSRLDATARRENRYDEIDDEVAVNVDAPGATRTPMLDDPARAATPPQRRLLGRFLEPAEIADLVGFLLSPRGRSITGQSLVVCTGASL
jgi:hypothetical protein